MGDSVDRGSTLPTGTSAAAAAAVTAIQPANSAVPPAEVATATDAEGSVRLAESTPSFSSLFPATRYFEIDSSVAGARFAAWVTPPAQYEFDKTQKYPVVYQMDGNLFFPATAPFHQAGQSDIMSPQVPFILVSVGYSERESQAWPWLRVRDLLPPDEPVPEVMYQAVEMSVKAELLSKENGDRYTAMFAHPAGDRFLKFLEDELHPLLAETYRIDGEDVGLWGDSYGGLFTSYVAIKRSKLFKRIGAGSPGIAGEDSQIFRLYDEAVTSKEDYSGRRLHVSLGAREFSQPSMYQWLTARGTGELVARTSRHPLPGLEVSTEIIPLETHMTGAISAWFSFLRACYGRPTAGQL